MFYIYVLLFFTYSFLGWIIETTFSYINQKKFVNRGFLLGPYCPIYGFGCLALTILLSRYSNDLFALFALTIILCSILEYFTSWLMEKIFKMRWWDYTHLKFNINGRICMETMIPFAVVGSLVVKFVSPFLIKTFTAMPNLLVAILSIILISIITVDGIISFNVIFNLKDITKNLRKDSTDDIKKIVSKEIKDNKYLYNRIVKAFPKMTKIIKAIKEKKIK